MAVFFSQSTYVTSERHKWAEQLRTFFSRAGEKHPGSWSTTTGHPPFPQRRMAGVQECLLGSTKPPHLGWARNCWTVSPWPQERGETRSAWEPAEVRPSMKLLLPGFGAPPVSSCLVSLTFSRTATGLPVKERNCLGLVSLKVGKSL